MTSYDYATVAYNAGPAPSGGPSGTTAPGSGGVSRGANAVAVSPNGSTVIVTGSSIGTNDSYDYATVAYNAATGAQRWAKRYDGPGSGDGQGLFGGRQP